MKQNKKDIIIFLASIVINLLILFLSPAIKYEEVFDKKLTVGLVTSKSKDKEMPQVQPKKTVSLPKEKKILSLDELSKTISERKTEILSSESNITREISSVVEKKILEKKELEELNENYEDKRENDISLNANEVVMDKKLENLEVDNNFEAIVDTENEENLNFEKIAKKDTVYELPNGYKLGVEDGDVTARWDERNKEAVYPKSAQLKGMQGKVLLKMKIDETGKVTDVIMEKGSGVPEINIAIEEIARTWKIYLSKNGLSIKGVVNLEYSFKLSGIS